MNQEISAGIVVYRRTLEGPKFLILYHGHNYWNFAKGKIESEEKSFNTAIRETHEETGLAEKDLRIVRNFKAYERFHFKRSGKQIFKIVIFYMAETTKREIKISKEHQGYAWFLYNEAKNILGKHKDSQKVLRKAYEHLRPKSNHSRPANPQRPNPNVPAGGPPRRIPPSVPSGR